MKFLGTVLFMIILKATKTRHLTSLGRYTFAKTTGVSNWSPSLFRVNVYGIWIYSLFYLCNYHVTYIYPMEPASTGESCLNQA